MAVLLDCAIRHWQPDEAAQTAVLSFLAVLAIARISSFAFREAKRSTTMMAADRSTHSCRALLFLFVLIGIPIAARSSTLEDTAKELAQKIAAALPVAEKMCPAKFAISRP